MITWNESRSNMGRLHFQTKMSFLNWMMFLQSTQCQRPFVSSYKTITNSSFPFGWAWFLKLFFRFWHFVEMTWFRFTNYLVLIFCSFHKPCISVWNGINRCCIALAEVDPSLNQRVISGWWFTGEDSQPLYGQGWWKIMLVLSYGTAAWNMLINHVNGWLTWSW